MKFQDVLRIPRDRDCTVVAGREVDFDFVWDCGTRFTEEGRRQFARVLDANVKSLTADLIELSDPDPSRQDDLIEELDQFLAIMAGFCPKEKYDRLVMEA